MTPDDPTPDAAPADAPVAADPVQTYAVPTPDAPAPTTEPVAGTADAPAAVEAGPLGDATAPVDGDPAPTADEPLGAAPVAAAPALPAQPVPPVPPAPQPHDLSRIAQDLQIRKQQVEAVVQLLDDGNTVPFITRYRKERTGGLDEVQLRRIQDRIAALRDLAARKGAILRSIAGQGRLTDDLVAALLEAEHPKRLEDLYLPYKQKKRTLATDAKEKGLEPLAVAVWTRDPAVEKLDEVLPGMVDPWKQLHDTNDVLSGVKHILAEVVAETAGVRGALRRFVWDTAGLVTAKAANVPEGKGNEFKDYFQFAEGVRQIPPHRVLALNRGERENVLSVRLDADKEIAKRVAADQLPLDDHPHRDLLLPVVDDAVERLLLPSLEREVRRELTEFAQDHAVDIFARNLRSLLLRPPLVGARVLAIDPGQRTGCKVAALDEQGALLEDAVIYPHPPQKKAAEAKRKLEQLIRKHQTPVVAIGNGTACRETEQLVSELFAELTERRLNPPPAVSPIPPVTASTAEPTPAGSVTTDATGVAAATVETVLPPAVDLSGGAGDTATTAGVGAAESEVVSSVPADAPPADAAVVVQSPPVEAAKPPRPADPPVSLEGLPDAPADLAYVVVNEAGASDYSASPVAREEFPTLDATTRGTISIGRRLQDPLAELVKVDPQHVGVGLYQHDVRLKYLRQSVETVIESCVNSVGVDLNTASAPLLRHVSGLNQTAAREIVGYRQQHGPFTTREQLKGVPQVGDARFTQAAGFLKIRDGDDPLDTTAVHPESYPLARQILQDLGFSPADLRDRAKLQEFRRKLDQTNPAELAQRLDAGEPTVRDIFDALARPGRDPREERPQPVFRTGILDLSDLKPGMELKGEVLNVVDFGAFVDVGLKDSGLVHISQLANRYIKSPYEVVAVGDVVAVWVMEVEPERKRVRLTMIPPGQERRPPERRPQQDRPPQPRREDRPPPPPRPPQQQQPRPQPAQGLTPGQRPGFVPRPGGGPTGTKPFGPKPGPRPRGPGAPGWRTSPKPPPAPAAAPAEGQTPAAEAAPQAPPPPPPTKKSGKPRAVPQLSADQKAGKAPVNSFAQLAALLRPAQPQPEPKPAEEPKPDAAPPAE